MAAKEQTISLEIKATPMECYRAICDFESYPQWQDAIVAAQILERDRKGRGKKVAYVLKAVVKEIKYTLEYSFDEKRKTRPCLSWTYVEGDIKNIEGSYTFEKIDKDTTLATYSLIVDPGMWVPGPILKKLNEVTMKGSIKCLKDRVEGNR